MTLFRGTRFFRKKSLSLNKMKGCSLLLLNVLFYVFTQNVFAKYLLVKMEKKEQITTKSALGKVV